MKLTILTLTALLAACGGPTEEPEIEMSYGALTERDEAAAFGDRELMREEPIDQDRPHDACRGGHIRARVAPPGDDGVGRFRGVFTNRAGDPIGHVRGLYGRREDGSNPIFGKMIARDGAFEARFRGMWERGDDGILFRARLHGRGGEAIGGVRGRIEPAEDRGGAMTAAWALACDAAIGE